MAIQTRPFTVEPLPWPSKALGTQKDGKITLMPSSWPNSRVLTERRHSWVVGFVGKENLWMRHGAIAGRPDLNTGIPHRFREGRRNDPTALKMNLLKLPSIPSDYTHSLSSHYKVVGPW